MKRGDCTGYCMNCPKTCIVWNPSKIKKKNIGISPQLMRLGDKMRIFKCVDESNMKDVSIYFRMCDYEVLKGFFIYSDKSKRFENLPFHKNLGLPLLEQVISNFDWIRPKPFYMSKEKFEKLIDERCVYYAERKIDQWNK